MQDSLIPDHALPDAAMRESTVRRPAAIHPLWLRINHWINALSVVVMIASGWRIYNASPIFPFRFPKEITLGGWLGGAIQWHFAAMWLLAINGAVYLLLNLATGRFRRKFLPLHPRGVLRDLRAALAGRPVHDDPAHYNMVQKAAYAGAIAALVVVVLSGLAVWKSVQFPLLRDLMGGFDDARVVHFCAMAVIVAFVAVHLTMVALVPCSLLAMLRGR